MVVCTTPQIVGIVALIIGSLLVIISIPTTFWTYKHVIAADYYRGLYEVCVGDHCVNKIKTSYEKEENKLMDWEIACLTLMSLSFIFGLVTLLSTICCASRAHVGLAVGAMFAMICDVGGVSVYAYYHIHDSHQKLDVQNFGWSFWLAVAGGALQLIATILFFLTPKHTVMYIQGRRA